MTVRPLQCDCTSFGLRFSSRNICFPESPEQVILTVVFVKKQVLESDGPIHARGASRCIAQTSLDEMSILHRRSGSPKTPSVIFVQRYLPSVMTVTYLSIRPR